MYIKTIVLIYLCSRVNEHESILVDGYEENLWEIGLCALLQV